MKKTLYLMRHGQTLFNVRYKIQGSCDSPLTELGIHQAKVAGDYYKTSGIEFDHAYCSTQERACDTLELITDTPYTRLKGLKEWDFGVFEGESEDLNPKHPKGETYGDFFVRFGGESDLDVQKRMSKTLTELMNKEDHQTVLAVSHGGAIFMFLRKWAELHEYENSGFSNCCILKFEHVDNRFHYIETIEHEL